MGRSREKLSIRLDWINVSYRAVYIAGGVTACLVVALILGIAYRETLTDLLSRARRDARGEIGEAQRLVAEASAYAHDARSTELRDNAGTKLQDARDSFDRKDYQDARTSAIVSQNYAQKVIDMGRGESATSREVRFYKYEGEVRVKRAGEFHWEDASPRMLLRIGDQIKTGPNGGAQIIYFDGTITTVRPESLLEIKDLYEESSTRQRRVSEKLNWGEVEATTRKANVAGSFHEVQSEGGTTAKSGEDSEFRVTYDQTKGAGSISAFAGKVDVATPQTQVSMKGGETVSIDKGVMGTVEKLPPPPRLLLPSDQKIFVYASPKDASTTLAWERVPEGTRYRLQLSERSLFAELLLDKPDVRTTTVEIPGLPTSAYYWRVATVDAAGRIGPFTQPYKFRITPSELRPGSDKTPPPVTVQDFIQNGPYIIINGRTEAGATLWIEGERIDVEESGAFNAVVRLKKEGFNQVHVVAQDPSGNETRKTVEAYVETY